MKANRHCWSSEHIELLRTLYPDCSAAVVAAAIGCGISAVYNKAFSLGLKKSEAFYASDRAGRVQRGKQLPSMVATQFKTGLVPWNTGIKGVTGTHPNSVQTQFKPGRNPEEARNYQPIGSLRVTKDGYLEKKLNDRRDIPPSRRWVALHRLVWEAANGPIPPGHIARFKSGQKTAMPDEITLDRIECISLAENLRRNSWQRKSPELARLVQLKGAITRQVNRISKESQST